MTRQIPEDIIEDGIGNVRLKVRCMMCRQVHTFQVRLEQYREYRAGALVQDAFPNLTPGQRELLISGFCDPCWDFTFKKQDNGPQILASA